MRKLVCDICGKELDERDCYNKEGDSQYMYVEIRKSRKYNAEYDICENCYEDILKYVNDKGDKLRLHCTRQELNNFLLFLENCYGDGWSLAELVHLSDEYCERLNNETMKNCKNCDFYVNKYGYGQCYGQKNAPRVEDNECCESWKKER